MKRPFLGRALRRLATASLLGVIFIGGIAVALDLERELLAGTEDLLVENYRTHFEWSDGGVGFTFTHCGPSRPPFEWVGMVLVPWLLWLSLPAPRPVELRLFR